MDEKKYTNVYDVRWREVYNETDRKINSETQNENCEVFGQIKFKKSKKRSMVRRFIKSMALVLVASISGAAAGAYVVEKRYSNLNANNLPQGILAYPAGDNVVEAKVPKSTITKVVESVGPAVVGISSKAENFYNRTINQFTGSGVVVRQDGMIVTNYHIIEGSENIYVKLSAGEVKPLNAKLIKYDKTSDLALIKVDITGLPVVKFADSSKVRVGDTAIAIGNPLGEEFAGTVTQGIISATNRKIEVATPIKGENVVYKVLETDAAINIGNSGGPLSNELGEVVAINNMNLGNTNNTQGMGYAISSDEVKRIIDDILSSSNGPHPILGIEGSYYEDKGITGVYVRQVYSGAAEAGILPTDIILEICGIKVTKANQISEILENYKVGDSVPCKVLRDDKSLDFKVELKEK